jgi:hypothetical protein
MTRRIRREYLDPPRRRGRQRKIFRRKLLRSIGGL